jgi:ferredoxin-NADP reductase
MDNMDHIVKILSITPITHDVRAYRLEKPPGYVFGPGQATDVSINKERRKDEKRPFTFTSLNEWPYLEFTIKSYGDHDGVTNQLGKLQAGDELIIRDVWGAISYTGEGYFIAGGAGITPFLAILRQLNKEGKIGRNQLFFSNKTARDIILQEELDRMLGANAHYILTSPDSGSGSGQPGNAGSSRHIDKDFLSREVDDFTKAFYICGPDKMVSELTATLAKLGAKPESLVFEK